MARPRSFDEDVVLDAAMHAFRREGYAAVSVSRLEEVTGLRTSSLYNTYGGKAGLFRAAFDHYVRSLVEPRVEQHVGPQASLEDVEMLYLSLFEPPFDDGYGCLVTNTATALGGDPLADGVADVLDGLGRHLDEVLAREVGSTDDTARLVLLYHGLLVVIRARQVTDRHRAAVRDEFARLRAQREEDA